MINFDWRKNRYQLHIARPKSDKSIHKFRASVNKKGPIFRSNLFISTRGYLSLHIHFYNGNLTIIDHAYHVNT